MILEYVKFVFINKIFTLTLDKINTKSMIKIILKVY